MLLKNEKRGLAKENRILTNLSKVKIKTQLKFTLILNALTSIEVLCCERDFLSVREKCCKTHNKAINLRKMN